MTNRHPIPDAALAQHIAVLGKTGSGKTSTAKLAIEQVVAEGARVCVLDPIKSDWWGLTSSADGKRAGLPFHILGGPRGHMPLHASAGKALGEIVATGALPLSILDMADFAPGGQAHFFTDFAPALLRKMRGVVYLVIEEAHLFAPKERSGVGKENLSIHWAKTLATAGRSKGIRLILATQRTQALHNALLGSCDTLIAHRLTAPADQEPIIKWLKANAEPAVLEQVTGSLASLKTGTAWLCSGEAKIFELVQFPRIKTYDNTATPTGDGDDHAVKTAPVDPEKLRAIIGDAVKEAEANDPTALKRRIAELERQVKAKVAPAKAVAPTRPAAELKKEDRDRARAIGFRAGFGSARNSAKNILHDLQRVVLGDQLKQAFVTATNEVLALKPEDDGLGPEPAPRNNPDVSRIIPRNIPPVTSARPVKNAQQVNGSEVSGVAQRILNALAELEQMGAATPKRELVAFMSNYSNLRSTGFAKGISGLSSGGLIYYPNSEQVALTDEGRAAAQPPEKARTAEELQSRVCNMLGGATSRVLAPLIRSYPKSMDRDDVAQEAGYTNLRSTGFAKAMSRLSSLGFIGYPDSSTIVAKPVLFLE